MSKPAFARLPLLLTVLVAALFLLFGSTGVVTAARQGVHITPNGFRTPLLGMSMVRSANGAVGTSCEQLTAPQVQAARFSRLLSRSMLRISPQAIVDTGAGVKFEIIYADPEGSGFNDSAEGAARRSALEAAAAAWSRVLRGTVTIKISATMEESEETEDGSTLLAVAGPHDFWLIDGTAVPSALAWQIQNRRNPASEIDIEVVVNPNINWEYATNGIAASDKVSFVYTLIHEIAHGLGFVDSFDPETGVVLNHPVPLSYDKLVNRGSDTRRRVIDRPDYEAFDDLRSGDLFLNGPAVADVSQRAIRPLPMAKLHAPDPYEPGSSISHVDQETYADLKSGLMTPRDFGGGTDKIDVLTLAVMKDMGYTLVPNAVTTLLRK